MILLGIKNEVGFFFFNLKYSIITEQLCFVTTNRTRKLYFLVHFRDRHAPTFYA